MKFSFVKDAKRYRLKLARQDLLAAFSVALLTIPQSIAYAMLAGLPPIAGVFSAVFGTIFVGVLGSSRYLIAGPTSSIAILIQITISDVLRTYYPYVSGMEREIVTMNILFHMVLIIGVLQLLFSVCKMGRLLQFVSRSVILGYFAGLMVAIIVNQLYPLLGIETHLGDSTSFYKVWSLFSNISKISFQTFFLGIGAILILFFGKRRFPKFPTAFFVILILAFLTYIFRGYFGEVVYFKGLGEQPFYRVFKVPGFDWRIINVIFPSALAIALLIILEVFSATKALSTKAGRIVDYREEILSVGICNSFLAFFGSSMPTSISISRTLCNFISGAKSRFSSIFSAFMVAIFIMLFGGLIKYVPTVALSAILIIVVVGLVDYRQIKFCFTVSRGDFLVFSLTFLACLFFSLDIAFFIGIVISIVAYLKRAAVPHVVEYAFNPKGRLVVAIKQKKVRRKVRIIGIGGELFFGSVELFQETFKKLAKDKYAKVIILRLSNVYRMDASMCFSILSVNDYLKRKGKVLVVSGITKELWQIFLRAGVIEEIGKENLFLSDEAMPQLSTWNACARAQEILNG